MTVISTEKTFFPDILHFFVCTVVVVFLLFCFFFFSACDIIYDIFDYILEFMSQRVVGSLPYVPPQRKTTKQSKILRIFCYSRFPKVIFQNCFVRILSRNFCVSVCVCMCIQILSTENYEDGEKEKTTESKWHAITSLWLMYLMIWCYEEARCILSWCGKIKKRVNAGEILGWRTIVTKFLDFLRVSW